MDNEISYPPTYYLIHLVDEEAIKVLKLYDSQSHGRHDYVMASRKQWQNASEATAYGLKLAQQHGLTFKHDRSVDDESYRESMLLD
ncbi:hypothetical protein DV532_28740 (plasmid) [Pseudomonas sp. Leaf58]|uniref:hypothetical protein n=1 Tax=Pseudomonas sp. Leaf58 TaxID=1736226 RepID=UPI0006F28C6B|nr:hypothetical protein [Pseudomonas sp. Leaf58]AYG48255.1 hypothetical protein DV532_28740 [Pseudomonas sp. Leaf58]KQN62197.1 hypothetical protein ASF02_08520 [Pseudomonas sp. Leaf58]